MASGVPNDVERFLRTAITSVQQLEVLLLLREERNRAWTAADVGARLRTHAGAAGNYLESLQLLGLASGEGGAYRYDPGRRGKLVDRLAELYPTYRTRIVGLIYSQANENVEAFADAFRLRRRKEEE
jgi:hypothetical protein